MVKIREKIKAFYKWLSYPVNGRYIAMNGRYISMNGIFQ